MTSAWVLTAPMPLRACGQCTPTAKKRLAMAIPRAPLPSRATIDQVIVPIVGAGRYSFDSTLRSDSAKTQAKAMPAMRLLSRFTSGLFSNTAPFRLS